MRISRVLLVLAIVAIVFMAGVASIVPLTSNRARLAIIAELSKRLDSTVELESFSMRLLPSLHAEGSGLVIYHRGRRDVPPLIKIRQFDVAGGFIALLRKHVTHVGVEGLEITIPPRDHDKKEEKGASTSDEPPMNGFVIDKLESVDAHVAILPSNPAKSPKVWSIHRLEMQSVGDQSMPFDAVVTNAVPPGEITTKGSFGPWNREEPGGTPLDGTFAFDHANLSVFKGISGILRSSGSYNGALGRIDVYGETETPDFTVKVGGHPVPLYTTYSATVDGTNGDTILNRIDASFLNTALVAIGRVIDTTPGQPGRMVKLDVTIDQGRIEDVLLLAMKASRPLVGALKLKTALVIPPGDRDVVEKLLLDGRFSMKNARFTRVDVSRKITDLSLRSRGQKPDANAEHVTSDFEGTFKLADGLLTIPAVAFDVPGAGVRLAGSYDLRRENIDFRGSLLTDAKVSQMTSGWKSWLLKVIDPLFGKDGGGSRIPIKVTGTRSDPSFGLDTQRVFSRDKTAAPADEVAKKKS